MLLQFIPLFKDPKFPLILHGMMELDMEQIEKFLVKKQNEELCSELLLYLVDIMMNTIIRL